MKSGEDQSIGGRSIQVRPIGIEGVDASGIAGGESFLQSRLWADFKGAQGWDCREFAVSSGEGSGGEYLLRVLLRPLGPLFRIAYVPLGPWEDPGNEREQAHLLHTLGRHMAPFLPPNTIYVRFDPPWGTSSPLSPGDDATATETFPVIPGFPAYKAVSDIQPPDTVLLSLIQTEEDILGGMKPKWRYNVRLGEKKGVTVRFLENRDALGAGIDFFYDLYKETAERDGIAIHSRAYYERLFSLASEYSEKGSEYSARLYCAEHEGTALASIITLFYGNKAVYLYGASSNLKRNLMPAYALQWAAIRDAKKWGCKEYDFYGISPTDDPRHPMHGLYRFKTGFGGSIVHRVGSLDIPLKPLAYRAYRLAEALRALWFKKILKALKR